MRPSPCLYKGILGRSIDELRRATKIGMCKVLGISDEGSRANQLAPQ